MPSRRVCKTPQRLRSCTRRFPVQKQNPRWARILVSGPPGRCRVTKGLTMGASVEVKLDFHADLHIHRLAILQSGIELPLLHGLQCLRVQAEAEAVHDPDVAGMSG